MNTAILGITMATIVSVHVCKAAWDWCSAAAKCDVNGKKEENTMCKYKENKQNAKYKRIDTSLSSDESKLLVAFHNSYRDKMAGGYITKWPAASNMRQMTWDNDLAKVALRWAYQIIHDHDACRRTEMFGNVGQNMNFIQKIDARLEGCFKSWADEILKTSSQQVVNSYEFGKEWGNFTNIIWAETYKIGCGGILLVPKDGLKVAGRLIVCNYGPGSVNGSQTYKRGKPCTSCPAGTACSKQSTHTNICALPGDPKNEEDIFIGDIPSSFRETKRMIIYYYPPLMLLITRLFRYVTNSNNACYQ